MKVPSSNEIKRLGKRLREEDFTGSDIKMLEGYREVLDPLLFQTAGEIAEIAVACDLPAVVGGRSKRAKSIIRKLRRPVNAGMDLSRMDDLIGVRVIVADLAAQDKMLGMMPSALSETKSVKDFRSLDTSYKAVHIVGKDGDLQVEVQIRTLLQQLWANESEAFGEATKEGRGTPEVKEYLAELSAGCVAVENGEQVANLDFTSPLYKPRGALTRQLPTLRSLFVKAAKAADESGQTDERRSFIVVYDNELKQQYQAHSFKGTEDERTLALEWYRYLSRTLDQIRYEAVILNGASKAALAVTHPRFFPEVL